MACVHTLCTSSKHSHGPFARVHSPHRVEEDFLPRGSGTTFAPTMGSMAPKPLPNKRLGLATLLRDLGNALRAALQRVRSWVSRRGTLLSARERRVVEQAALIRHGLVDLGAEVAERLDLEEIKRFTASWTRRNPGSANGSQTTLCAPVRTQYYAHGAFMGAAPALLGDARWLRILAFLMPDVLEHISEALGNGAGAPSMISMLENNPVSAAFGVVRSYSSGFERSTEGPIHLSGIEWDLFVDEDLLGEWERCHDDPKRLHEVMEAALDTCLVAHGNPTDLVQEALGLCQYADVRRTKKTEMGGVEIDAWLDLFGRAIALSRAEDFDAAIRTMATERRSSSIEECMRHTFASVLPTQNVLELFRTVTQEQYLSIIIDVKSLRSTPAFLKDFVRALNGKGIHVSAIGSFIRSEVEGVADAPQRIGSETLPGPRELQFFHLAGDLQDACDGGRITRGQHVLFNGASLLTTPEPANATGRYSPRSGLIDAIESYRIRYGLAIGFYVQEADCDRAAAESLALIANNHPTTFELGFAWGGLRDAAFLPEDETARLGYGNQKLLEMVGKARQWRLQTDGPLAPEMT
jgi:hypothetical protein